MKLIYVIGCTNVGKSTFIDAADPAIFGRIQVGKMMRAKYPPSHFQGEGNPSHTAKEAWVMYEEAVFKCYEEKYRYVLIDGQPRDFGQAERLLENRAPTYSDRVFLWLWCHHTDMMGRAARRDGMNAEKLKLTEGRLQTDYQNVNSVIGRLLQAGEHIVSYNTSTVLYDPLSVLDRLKRI